MKAQRITFALFFLIFYSSCIHDDSLLEDKKITEYNTYSALAKNSSATHSSIVLADFFQDYNFDHETEVRLPNGGKLISYPSLSNRIDKITAVYDHANASLTTILEQKGNELLVYNEQLILSTITKITSPNSRDFINCLLALAEYSVCVAVIVDDAINNPIGYWGTLWSTNPAGFIIQVAIHCEFKVIELFGIWNQLGCLLPVPL